MTEKPKAVLVTGATGGIGSALCEQLAPDHLVIAQYSRNEEKALALEARLGERVELVQADLSRQQGVESLVEQTLRVLDRHEGGTELWGVVNAAALLLGPSFDEATPEAFDRYFAVNAKAPFFVVQALRERIVPGGSVVNVSSANAHFSSPGDIVYSMAKTALESMTRNLAELLGKDSVRINTVVPGFTDNGHPAFQDPAALVYMGSFSALGSVARADDVAESIRFLLSEQASRITGATLDVSGGSLLGLRGGRQSSVRDLIR